MTYLTIEIVAGNPPALDSFLEGPAWLDGDGAVCARVFQNGAGHWIDWRDLGVFAVPPSTTTIHAWPAPGIPSDVVVDFFERRLQPLILQARGYQVLHASAIRTNSSALAFTGRSGCGKSTLAYSLGLAGYQQLSDDALVFDMSRSPPAALPLPFIPQLRGDARALASRGQPAAVASEPVPLRAIVVLKPDARTAEHVLKRIAGPAACIEVLAHAHLFDEADRQRLITDYARLADCVPIYTLAYRPGLSELPDLHRAVLALGGAV